MHTVILKRRKNMAKRKRKKNKLPGGRVIRKFKGHATPWVDIARPAETYGESMFEYYVRKAKDVMYQEGRDCVD